MDSLKKRKESSFNDFEIKKKLGEGAYCEVYKVKKLSDNKIYAMKIVKLNMLSKKEKENALNEVRILASISDTNLISFKDAFFDNLSNCLCIIMEFANGGDISSKIQSAKDNKEFIKEDEIWNALYQISSGYAKNIK